MFQFLIIFYSAMLLTGCNTGSIESTDPATNENTLTIPVDGKEIATLGAGCFWCVEAVFQELKGVESVTSGYMGGHVKNPSYKQVSNGTSGHAEVAQIVFDPSVISFEELLEIFWTTHDPTTKDRQGNDVGPQYRSAIFYHSDSQKQIAEKSKAEVATDLWGNVIVTEITKASTFYEAEAYHQDFYAENPNYGYCRVIINPKLEKVHKKFADKLKESD